MKTYGLTGEQARTAKEKFGDNRLTEQAGESFWEKLRGNFGDPMIKILCAALIVNVALVAAYYLGLIADEMAWYEPVGIAVAILLATLVSTFSEYRNENAFQVLQKEASKIHCKVYRDGAIVELPIDDIVVGDAVLLQAGDKIPADGFVISGSLKVDQSALNGETAEAVKVAAAADYVFDAANKDLLQSHNLFRGSVVYSHYGHAVMRVAVVGDQSLYGKIAAELSAEDERETPLKLKLSRLAGMISQFGYIGGVAIAVAMLFSKIVVANHFNGAEILTYCSTWTHLLSDLLHAVMLAVIIIVMAVPEGLPLMIAIVSALNMGKMLRDHVLVRKIAGIETAGSLNFLFSDKTGTITRGKLQVVNFISGADKSYAGLAEVENGLQKYLLLSALGNTDALLSGGRAVGGNATERAILDFAAGAKLPDDLAVAGKIPFNSANKYSATTLCDEALRDEARSGAGNLTLIKGAPEKMIERCKFYYDADGVKKPYANHAALTEKINELANRAMRVLAFAVSEQEIVNDELPAGDWTLVGVVGIRDEIRPESIVAIKEVQSAGVQVVMITGDRKETAVAIAKEAGLLQKDDDLAITSDELGAFDDAAVKEKLPRLKVVARALPNDKSRLVRLAQELNYVVGMTGDGVNDSPALKKADVGFAMGGGTEVAKSASEIVILDDNFSSIDKAILYGRTIFNSIRKFIIFQLTINVSAVLINFVMLLLGYENPLSITQILWVNLIMDTLAALAFGGEPALARFMREPPKRRDEPIVSAPMWSSIFTGAAWTTLISFLFLFLLAPTALFPGLSDKTGYFALFVFIAVFNGFNARTEKRDLLDNLGRNRGFLQVFGIIAVVQAILVYAGREILHGYGLNGWQWLVVLVLAASIIPIDLARKALRDAEKCPFCRVKKYL
ncbi:calcium-translocating P-type ATPase, PMCA-type [Planctomycetales bacterium]|nr:calcium-translocating P-type ATPase, PMCA-type [Planctomycetales bacterium]GHT06958.1 calcium-translocating P-type ATPase, PMCA-type [Planctomycetales bacterium]